MAEARLAEEEAAETRLLLRAAWRLPLRAAISFFSLRASAASTSFRAAAADLADPAASDMLLVLLAGVSLALLPTLLQRGSGAPRRGMSGQCPLGVPSTTWAGCLAPFP